jgi:hypothetical protein
MGKPLASKKKVKKIQKKLHGGLEKWERNPISLL